MQRYGKVRNLRLPPACDAFAHLSEYARRGAGSRSRGATGREGPKAGDDIELVDIIGITWVMRKCATSAASSKDLVPES